nr:phospholipase A1 member A-like [Onthophagus taurus]
MPSTTSSNYKVMLNPFEPLLPDGFNFSAPIKIIIHGYAGNENNPAVSSIPKTYTSAGYQAIMVDWSSLAKAPCYPAAFLNTWHVGQCVAILAASLSSYGIMPNQFHALGFSLGAHIASFASNHLKKVIGFSLGRITGLDPALPFFASHINDWKLDPSDADFVDVIHTNAGSFGKIEPIGHADFYVNGGSTQPACENNIYTPYCSHMMVNLYYSESIVSKKFVATECPSVFDYLLGSCSGARKRLAIMGEHCDSK